MAAVSKIEHGVVELRTDVGRLYVCPTGWQRLYLRWTFRNFHSLPQQILNRRQKRLIENLSRSAILSPAERVPASAVIGIVENMTVLGLPSTGEMAEPAKTIRPAAGHVKLAVVQGRAEEAVLDAGATEVAQTTPAERVAPREISPNRSAEPPASLPESSVVYAPEIELNIRTKDKVRSHWGMVLGGLAVAAVLLLGLWLAPVVRLPQLSVAPAPVPPAPPLQAIGQKPVAHKKIAPAAQDPQRAAAAVQPLNGAATTAAAAQHVAQRMASAAAAQPAATAPDSAALPQIVEAPRSGFIYPVAPNPNLVGKVVLKAVVGSDGTVKQVEVLSGDRALAAAAVHAVRRWHYAPAQVAGHTVDAETHVTISFLGDDAVSIILPQSR